MKIDTQISTQVCASYIYFNMQSQYVDKDYLYYDEGGLKNSTGSYCTCQYHCEGYHGIYEAINWILTNAL